MAGANPSRAEWEGPLERGQEMARRSPAVTGNEVRVSQTRIQVEPRTALFALSRYSRLRAFLFALGHEKNLWSWQGGGLPPPPAQNMDR